MSKAFLEELHNDAEDYFEAGARNNMIDIAFNCTVVAMSVVAAILAAANLPDEYRWLLVAVAAMPAAITSVQSKLRSQELSTWYFRYSAALKALENELRYDPAATISDIVARRAQIDKTFEDLWFELKTRPLFRVHPDEKPPSAPPPLSPVP